MIRKKLALLWVFLLLIVLHPIALAQTARDITAQCQMLAADKAPLACIRDRNYKSRWAPKAADSKLTITAPEGEAIGGVYVQFYNHPCAFEVQVKDDSGQWQRAAACDTGYRTGYAALENAAQQIRIRPQNKSDRLMIAEIHVFAQGEAPGWVQQWEAPCEKADLLVISAHPDDELIFMGGAIPYYAGELGMRVQVAYLVPATPYRILELLDGLWLCGNRTYPDIGSFPDRFATSISGMYAQEGWSEALVTRHMVRLYRQYRPEVVITHDVQGEYGHGAHKVAADTAQKAVALAAEAGYQSKRLLGTQPWQIKKLYLHLYEQGAMRMDWRKPLDAFGGKTAFDMAQAGFACHISQQDAGYQVEDFGPYDNALFGLAFSLVGEDVQKNDFFEHINNFCGEIRSESD